jgi:hypothetical protein
VLLLAETSRPCALMPGIEQRSAGKPCRLQKRNANPKAEEGHALSRNHETGGTIMVAVLFPVTSAPGARPQESAGRLVNAYAVKTEQGAPTPLRWTRTSGLRELMTVAGQAGFRVTSPTTAIFPRRWGRQVLNSERGNVDISTSAGQRGNPQI